MKNISILLLILYTISCGQEEVPPHETDISSCKIYSAKRGFNGSTAYSAYFDFEYTEAGLLERIKIDDGAYPEKTMNIFYENGKMSHTITSDVASETESHTYFRNTGNLLIETTYSISNEDTLTTTEYARFMPEVTDDGLYFSDGEDMTVFEVKGGNVRRIGIYTVNGNQKSPHFTEEYTYDAKPNYFEGQFQLLELFEMDFAAQRSVSQNNMVAATSIPPAWARSQFFEFDDTGLPEKAFNSSGVVIYFTYQCAE